MTQRLRICLKCRRLRFDPLVGKIPLEKGMATHSSILAAAAATAAKSLQSCPTLCDPIDSSPPGSPIPGILQARTLEWVAISFSNAWKWKVKMKSLSSVRLLTTPWTAAYQAPPSLGLSRQEHCSGLPFPSPMHESEVLSHVRLFATPWIAAHQAPPPMVFSRQECSLLMKERNVSKLRMAPGPSPIGCILG